MHAHALPAIYLLALRHAYIMEALTLLTNMKTVYSQEPQIAARLDTVPPLISAPESSPGDTSMSSPPASSAS